MQYFIENRMKISVIFFEGTVETKHCKSCEMLLETSWWNVSQLTMLPANRLVMWLDTVDSGLLGSGSPLVWSIHKPWISSKHRRKHNGVVTELPWWQRSLWNFPVNPTERSSSLSAKPLPDTSIDFDLQIYQTQRSSSVLINQKTLIINHDYWLL